MKFLQANVGGGQQSVEWHVLFGEFTGRVLEGSPYSAHGVGDEMGWNWWIEKETVAPLESIVVAKGGSGDRRDAMNAANAALVEALAKEARP